MESVRKEREGTIEETQRERKQILIGERGDGENYYYVSVVFQTLKNKKERIS